MAPVDKDASSMYTGSVERTSNSAPTPESSKSKSARVPHPYLIPMPDLHDALQPDVLEALHEIEEQFTLDGHHLKKITDQMLWEYKTGLSTLVDDTNRDTFLPMIPTYVHAVPNGTETGVFLALDLGGTNLRVCEVTLQGQHTFKMRHDKYKISDALKTGPATELFDFIAQCVEGFIATLGTQDKKETNEPLYLGFTFSFPVQQTALDKGTLISWTKGFTCSGAQGNDVVQLLQTALNQRNINVKCAALVNDTVGTLLSHAYQSGAAVAGAIFGTGTNGAYVERTANITKDIPSKGKHEYMIVNTEWGAFDNERKVLRITPHDNKCDRKSVNPRKQAFEKMVSGMYIGEVVRNVLLSLIDRGYLFKGHSSTTLNRHYGLDTALMSAIEALPAQAYSSTTPPKKSDWQASVAETRKVLTQNVNINDEHITDEDCLLVRRVSEIVGTRGARLAAVAVATTIIQTGYDKKGNENGVLPEFSIGVDGSLVELYPHFEIRLRQALVEIVGQDVERKVRFGLAKDGSGVGAALTALAAYQQRHAQV